MQILINGQNTPTSHDDEIMRVLNDHEGARQRFNPNSPTFQRIAGRLTRDYIRLAQKSQQAQIAVASMASVATGCDAQGAAR